MCPMRWRSCAGGRSRTILTALGLAVGVALVVVVNAVSTGLDDAQRKVLEPLTGVGTDMSVTRPLKVSQNGQLSQSQQNRFRRLQGGGPGLQFQKLKPGQKVNVDTFTAAGQLTFSQARVKQIWAISGVSGAAGSLTSATSTSAARLQRSPASSRTAVGLAGLHLRAAGLAIWELEPEVPVTHDYRRGSE